MPALWKSEGMRLASAIFLALLALPACSGSGSSDSSSEKLERFPVPDDLVGTKYEMDCDKAKPQVKDRDELIGMMQKFMVEPDLSDATRSHYRKKLTGILVDRALIIAANPSCFSVARLKEAHEITDARDKTT